MIAQNASLPSLSTVKKKVSFIEESCKVGLLDFDGLFKHMKKYKTTRIMISEDATRLISKVTYDSKANSLVGLIGPTDPATGLPILDFFRVQLPSEIQRFLSQYKAAKFIQLIMAEPLEIGLCYFSSTFFFSSRKLLIFLEKSMKIFNKIEDEMKS